VRKTKHKWNAERKWTNGDLLDSFNELNHKYFGNKLKTPDRLAFFPIEGLGHTFRFRKGKRRSKNDTFGIHISSKLRFSKRLWLGTLIHEMTHLEQGNKYSCTARGRVFNWRMVELAVGGIFYGVW
jgi:hypothetical protein